MEIWPSQLPAPVLNSFNETPPNNTIRSNMDKGPSKVRRRTTANVRPISFTLKLMPALVTVLDTFYDITTFSGADPFTFTHPRTLESVTAQFAEPPSYGEMEGVLYTINISLEILPS